MKAVLVGCGSMSRAWLEAARRIDDLSVVGLVDIDLGRVRSRAAEFGLEGAELGSDLAEVLDRAKPDVVFDVVVPQARASVVLTSLARGCHVLTEKPLAASLAEGRTIIAAAKAANRLHAVVQNRRYLAPIRRIQRFLESGAIGRPTSLHCDFFLAPHFGGFREEMDHVLLLDMAIHTFDAARAMTGLEAKRVYCHEWNPKNSWYRQGASAAAIFEMEGGAVFTYRGSWCADGARTSWEAAWRIVGERGSLVWDGFDTLSAEVAGEGREGLFARVSPVEIAPIEPAARLGGHLGVMQDFIAAIRGGGTNASFAPETAGPDNFKSLAMVFGAIGSAACGAPVDIETLEERT